MVLSLGLILKSYPLDFVVYRFSSIRVMSQMDTLWCLEASYFFLIGPFFYRMLDLEISPIKESAVYRICTLHILTIIPFSVYQSATHLPKLHFEEFGIYLPFNDAHSFGSYVVFCFFFLVYYKISEIKQGKIFPIIFPCICLVMIILSGSRITWIAMLLIGIVLVLRKMNQKWRILTVYSILIVLLAVNLVPPQMYEGTNKYIKRLSNLTLVRKWAEDESVKSRLALWQRAAKMSTEYPFTGTGIGTFYRVSTSFHDSDPLVESSIRDLSNWHENTHNYFLQLSSELGWPALLIFLLVLYIAISRLANLIKEEPASKYLGESLMLGLSAYLITMLTGHPLLLPIQQILFWFILSFATSLSEVGKFKLQNSKLSLKVKALSGLCIIIFLFGFSSEIVNPKKLDWAREYGFYGYENWNGEEMRWTWKRANKYVTAKSNLFGLKTVAFPQNSKGPEGLNVKIFLNDKLWDEINFFDGGVRPKYYYVNGIKNSELEIRTEVSETFNPKKLGLNSDPRDLGIVESAVVFLRIFPADGVGFYGWETWQGEKLPCWPANHPQKFRWTGRRATINLKNVCKEGCNIYLRGTHPDIQTNPVKVRMLGTNGVLDTLELSDTDCKVSYLPAEKAKELNRFTIEIDRTWNPKLWGVSEDTRDLGVAFAVSRGQNHID